MPSLSCYKSLVTAQQLQFTEKRLEKGNDIQYSIKRQKEVPSEYEQNSEKQMNDLQARYSENDI